MIDLSANPVARLNSYELRHLVTHLVEVGLTKELHHLLALETISGSNAWFEVKQAHEDLQGYLDDINRAWHQVDDEYRGGQAQNVVGLQCRYALITASIGSVAKNIPPGFLIALIKQREWSLAQGLTYANNLSYHDRAEVLAGIAQLIPRELMSRFRAIMHLDPDSSSGGSSWGMAMAGLMPYLSCQQVEQVMDEALSFTNEDVQAEALTSLAPHIPASLIPKVLASVQKYKSNWQKGNVLVELAHRLAEIGQQDVALTLIDGVERDDDKAKIIHLLAPKLNIKQLEHALTLARGIVWHECVELAIIAIAPYLAGDSHPELLSEAITAVRELSTWDKHANAIAVLAAHLPVAMVEELVLSARNIKYEPARAWALITMATFTSMDLYQEAIEASRAIRNSSLYERTRVLNWMIPMLPARYLKEIVADCIDDFEKDKGTFAIESLVSRLAQEGFQTDALEYSRQLPEGKRSVALSRLAAYLPEIQRDAIYREAIEDATIRLSDVSFNHTSMIEEMVQYLPGTLLKDLLKSMEQIGDEKDQLETLAKLALFLPIECLKVILADTSKITPSSMRPNTLIDLLLHANELGDSKLALEIISNMDEWDRGQALLRLAPQLPDTMVSDALRLATTSELGMSLNGSPRAIALAILASRLPPEEQDKVRGEIMEIILNLNTSLQVDTWVGVIPYWPKHRQEAKLLELFEKTKQIKDNKKASNDLSQLAYCCMKVELWVTARLIIQEINDSKEKVLALTELLQGPNESEYSNILQDAVALGWSLPGIQDQIEVIAGLCPFLPDSERDPMTEKLLSMVQNIGDLHDYAWSVYDIAPLLSEENRALLLRDAVNVAREISREPERDARLRDLVFRIAEFMDPLEALRVAQELPQRGQSSFNDRERAMKYIARQMGKLPENMLGQGWDSLVHSLVVSERKYLLHDLGAFASVMFALGGQNAVEDVFHSVQDASRWWP